MDTIADRVRWARQVAGVSQRELSELAGLSPWALAPIEKGKRSRCGVRLDTARKLAATLDCTLVWLLDGAGKPPSQRRIKASIAAALAGRGPREKRSHAA